MSPLYGVAQYIVHIETTVLVVGPWATGVDLVGTGRGRERMGVVPSPRLGRHAPERFRVGHQSWCWHGFLSTVQWSPLR